MNIENFEELFGNTPFKNIEKIQEYIDINFIPIQKIKEKIAEYKERKAKCNDIESEIRLDVKIRAYEELLEGRE